MKKSITILLFTLFFINITNAQIIIGTDINNITSTTSSLIQFQDNNSKGIILPANTQTPTSPTNGTFLYDQTDQKVKMYENNSWVNLSDIGDNSSLVKNVSDDNGDGIILGANSSSARGVLVLESSEKALVLPRVNDPVATVISPYPGMICYDTTSKTIAIFDGKKWNFWK